MSCDGTVPTTTSTRAASRKTRVYVFRDFLIRTYGEYLRKPQSSIVSSDDTSSSFVLDVAGGKGDLSWLLCNVDDIPSIVLDPRGSVASCAIPKSVRYLRDHPEEAKRRAVPGASTYQPLAKLIPKLLGKEEFIVPQHLRINLNQDLVKTVHKIIQNKHAAYAEWEAYWFRSMKESKSPETRTGTFTDTAIIDAKKALQAIFCTKLVVGFHPDQGTDYCVELAQILGVPFCIVPCCVFPAEFPNRQLSNSGERVRDYRQLIEYLREKSPKAKTAFLDFHFTETAKNLVLYTFPEN